MFEESSLFFANRLRQARKSKHLTQQQLAELSDLSTHYIGNLEQGVRRPTLDTLLRLSEVLDILPTDLIYDYLPENAKSKLAEADPNLLREEPSFIYTTLSDLFAGESVHVHLREDGIPWEGFWDSPRSGEQFPDFPPDGSDVR